MISRDLLTHNSLKSKEGENGVGANSVTDSHHIVVDFEDKNRGLEGDMDMDMDMGIFAPVESSDCEEDDEEERSRRTNNGELDNTEDVDPSEEPSSSFQGCRKRKSNVLAEQNAECSEADKKMESNKVSKKKCIKCNMAIGVATKVCKACGEAQPMRRKLQKKIKKYDEAWASAPMENGKLNNLFDETNLLLHKWQLLGMYPLFLLGGKRRSKTVTQCLCPIKFKHPQNKEAQDTMRQIFVRLINAQQTALEPIVTKAPAQPPAPQLQLIQPQRALQPVIPSLVAQQVPVFQSLVQPLATHLPVTQSLCSTPPTVKGITDDDLMELRRLAPNAAIFTSMDISATAPLTGVRDKAVQHTVQVKVEKLD
ncbi:putative zinc finger MYM-type protein 3-like [Triplophysa rosa]|uniref:Zinc finger MYM-type protein 3-like n=2 Tax=Triplophysa rosa TaxID=992332 RepID=A0A9W7WD47_TRIRA|nr:putative zinc finger MYM-type protein 3-like [Triplophysa rosa]